MQDAIFVLAKDIPLQGGGTIKKGTHIHLINDLFYLEEGLLEPEFQEDFRKLYINELKHGFKYLKKSTL